MFTILEQCEEELAKISVKLDENFRVVLGYPKCWSMQREMVEKNKKIQWLNQQIDAYKAFYEYTQSTDSADERELTETKFKLNSHLCTAYEKQCPLTFPILTALIIEMIQSYQELGTIVKDNEIYFINNFINQAKQLLGGVGNFIAFQLYLALDHHQTMLTAKLKSKHQAKHFNYPTTPSVRDYYALAMQELQQLKYEDVYFNNAYMGLSVEEILATSFSELNEIKTFADLKHKYLDVSLNPKPRFSDF